MFLAEFGALPYGPTWHGPMWVLLDPWVDDLGFKVYGLGHRRNSGVGVVIALITHIHRDLNRALNSANMF